MICLSDDSNLSSEEVDYHLLRRSQGDSESRNLIIEYNMRLVSKVVKKYTGDSYDIEELMSAGTIGLIKAIDSFDVNKGCTFSTYAYKCINNEILLFLRQERKHKGVLSLNDLISDYTTDSTYSGFDRDCSVCDESIDFVGELEDKTLCNELKNIVSDLPDRERTIISLYFGFDGNEPLTQREVAISLEISPSYVSILLRSILDLIRNKLIESEFMYDTHKKIKKK